MARLHQIKTYDMENSWKGASVSLWFNHCPHRCEGCWNPETWDQDDSLEVPNDEIVVKVLGSLGGPFNVNTVALLGGDPLSPTNISDTIYILGKVLDQRPETKVICWTGFTWEQVTRNNRLKAVLPFLDVLIDGRFMLERKIEGRKYGSDNQRVIDVKQSLLDNVIREAE